MFVCGARVCVLSSDGLFLVNIRTPPPPPPPPREGSTLGCQIRSFIVSSPNSRQRGRNPSAGTQRGPGVSDQITAGQEAEARGGGGRGRGFRPQLTLMNVPVQYRKKTPQKQKENEVNAYVNKTKSTRGQDLANPNLCIAEIFNVFK